MEPRERMQLAIKGEQLRDSGDLNGAIAAWEAFVADFEQTGDPGPEPSWISDTYYNLADVYEAQNRIEDAAEVLQKALVLLPDEPDYLFNYGMFCGRLGKFDKAAAAFRHFLEVAPDSPNTQQVRETLAHAESMVSGAGTTQAGGGETGETQELYDEAVSLLLSNQPKPALLRFKEMLRDESLTPSARAMAHYGAVQSIVNTTAAQNLKECFRRLSGAEKEELRNHLEAMERIRKELRPDQLNQEVLKDAYDLATSLLLAFSALDMKKTEQQKAKKSKCFIATACFGTPVAPEVKLLCSFRDRVLTKRRIGRAFIAGYYAFSPGIASWLDKHDWSRAFVRHILIPPVVFAVKAGWRRQD